MEEKDFKKNEETPEEILEKITAELKKRYPEGKIFDVTLVDLERENKDLPISKLNTLTKQVLGIFAKEYLMKIGNTETKIEQKQTKSGVKRRGSSIEEKLIQTTNILKEKYAKKRVSSWSKLASENPDINISTLKGWVRKVHNKSLTDYLTENGILYTVDHARRDFETTDDKFLIVDGVLCGCKGIGKKLIVPDGVKSIGSYIFLGEEKDNSKHTIEEIVFSDTVTSIHERAFQGCVNLKNVIFPSSIKRINYLAFSGCASLETVTLSENLDEICWCTFSGCSSLRSISIPKGIKKIGEGAFCKCTCLEEITILSKNIDVSEKIFYDSSQDSFLDLSKMRIICPKTLIPKLPISIRSICADINKDDKNDTTNIYKVDLNFLLSQFIDIENINDLFGKCQLPKESTFRIETEKQSFKAKSKLYNIPYEIRGNLFLDKFYDMYIADRFFLSKDEMLEKYWQEDPNGRTDGFMYVKASVDENAPSLTSEEIKGRFILFMHIANRINCSEVMNQIADEMPKKKDGTFVVNRIMRIASSRIVKEPDKMLQIFAKAESGTTLVVFADYRTFSQEEVMLFEEDFICRHPDVMGLNLD